MHLQSSFPRRIDSDGLYFFVQIGFYVVGEPTAATVEADVYGLGSRRTSFSYPYCIANRNLGVRKYLDFLEYRSAF